jgi:hypothetical protein
VGSLLCLKPNLPTAALLAVLALVSCGPASTSDERMPSNRPNTIRPLLGVNGGPTPFQPGLYPDFVDTTKQFQALGVNAIRMEDYFGPGDITCMFPDPAADPTDESNYDFAATDAVFQAVVDGNFRPMLRLGQSWKAGEATNGYDVEQPTGGMFPDKPTAYPGCEFWADGLAAGVKTAGPELWNRIVSRYSDASRWGSNPLDNGWVEIWNEPNIPGTTLYWDAEPEAFYEFFATTATSLATEFPDLTFGGPASHGAGCTTPEGRQWVQEFLAYQADHDVSLDFFSWHWYGANIDELRGCYEFFADALDQHGYGGTPQIVTEYNTDAVSCAGAGSTCHPHGEVSGGALATVAWIEMQSWPDLEGVFFYRGADGPFIPNSELTMPIVDGAPCPGLGCDSLGGSGFGLLYGDGTRKPQGAAFALWSMLAGWEVVDLAAPSLFVSEVAGVSLSDAGALLTGGLPTLGVLAGRNDAGQTRLLVANPQNVPVTADIAGLLATGGVDSGEDTRVTVTSLSPGATDLISTSTADFSSLGSAELAPFGVLVFEVPR